MVHGKIVSMNMEIEGIGNAGRTTIENVLVIKVASDVVISAGCA